MFDFFFNIIGFVLWIYALLVIAHFILTLIKLPANKWTTILASIVEPALKPVRVLVNRILPQKLQIIDWSPVALLIVISIVQALLGLLSRILP